MPPWEEGNPFHKCPKGYVSSLEGTISGFLAVKLPGIIPLGDVDQIFRDHKVEGYFLLQDMMLNFCCIKIYCDSSFKILGRLKHPK